MAKKDWARTETGSRLRSPGQQKKEEARPAEGSIPPLNPLLSAEKTRARKTVKTTPASSTEAGVACFSHCLHRFNLRNLTQLKFHVPKWCGRIGLVHK